MRLKPTAALLVSLFAFTAVPAFAQTSPSTAPGAAPGATLPAPATPAVPAKPSVTAPATAAPATVAPVAAPPAVKPVTKPTIAKAPIGPVNVNTATAAQLDKLPGIGKSRSKAIINGRPYKAVDEIDTKKIIPHTVYEKIKAQLTL